MQENTTTPDFILLHECDIPVRWGDLDALGHVNNTLHFRFMEQARVEWLDRQALAATDGPRAAPVVAHAACTYREIINYPATVRVRLHAGEPGRSSVMTRYALSDARDGRLYATGEAKMVWVDLDTGKSVPLPEALRALFD